MAFRRCFLVPVLFFCATPALTFLAFRRPFPATRIDVVLRFHKLSLAQSHHDATVAQIPIDLSSAILRLFLSKRLGFIASKRQRCRRSRMCLAGNLKRFCYVFNVEEISPTMTRFCPSDPISRRPSGSALGVPEIAFPATPRDGGVCSDARYVSPAIPARRHLAPFLNSLGA